MSFLKREHWLPTVVTNDLLVLLFIKYIEIPKQLRTDEKVFTNIDPLECILCKVRIYLVRFDVGLKDHEL